MMFQSLKSRLHKRPLLRTPGTAHREFVSEVRSAHRKLHTLSDRQLRSLADDLRESKKKLPVQSAALTTEALVRTSGKTLYDVQLMAGLVLQDRAIAEMQTGEGKTVTTLLPAVQFALNGRKLHVSTTNDYLAERDWRELQPTLELLGISSGIVRHDFSIEDKQKAYASDVVFGTGSSFGFDYLRDQLTLRAGQNLRLGDAWLRRMDPVPASQLTGQCGTRQVALIDEIDSILIDEAGTPLVISGGTATTTAIQAYQQAAAIARQLRDGIDFNIIGSRSVKLTSDGVKKIGAGKQPATALQRPWLKYVENALHAANVLEINVDYVVQEAEVRIVDQFTGRIQEGRTWRDGLHQAVELSAGLVPSEERPSHARISRQRFVSLYETVCGLTGTAAQSAAEFQSVYQLGVTAIPSHRPSALQLGPDQVFASADARDFAIAAETKQRHQSGQPVLIGTRTIAHSQTLADCLKSIGIEAEVLNGLQYASEAEVIAVAGKKNAVTIATNMAGRGTDIRPDDDALAAGGLHVIGAERNCSRRIDRQLVGRAARQGQPGSGQFFLSAQDQLFENAGPLKKLIQSSAASDGRANIELGDNILHLQNQQEAKARADRENLVRHEQWLANTLDTLAGVPA